MTAAVQEIAPAPLANDGTQESGDEAQRDQRQSGRALPREAGRARHRLGQGQDLGPRRQGPDRAQRRRDQRLRGRPDPAASPAAEARLQQQDLPEGLQGRQSRPPAAGARCRQARPPRTRSTARRWSPPACCAGSGDGVRLLAKGELKAAITIEVAGASKAAIAAVEKAGGKVVLPAGAAAPKPSASLARP